MGNWTYQLHTSPPQGSYEWLYIALEFYSILSLCKAGLNNILECMLNIQNVLLYKEIDYLWVIVGTRLASNQLS